MKYASVFKRPKSSFWYIIYWDPAQQKRRQLSTPFKLDDPQGKRKALELAQEKGKWAAVDKGTLGVERWETWVESFLRTQYAGEFRQKTLIRMMSAWRQWALYMSELKLAVPRSISHLKVLGFIEWRMLQIKRISRKRVTKNTALTDVKCFSIIMREAIRRGFASSNPCEKLGITRDPPAEKPEIADDEIRKIRAELNTRPEWMQICFEIALHQGCRLSETSIPLERIDLERETITFSAKGRAGQPRVFTARLHNDLKPIIDELKRRGAKVTCVLPRMAAKEWHFLFKKIGLPHIKFHCTRVTVVTRMARAGVPIQQAQTYVNHASSLVHKIYNRLGPKDQSRAIEALKYPS